MFRKSALAAAMLLVSLSPQIFALGLGDIDMRSALNQPMEAVIELTSANAADLANIKVTLASLDDHARAGLSKAAVLTDFRFTVEKNAAGKPIVRISSDALVREPYLEFMLELDWPRGRLLRQYTVLVDPPVMMPATPAIPAAPVSKPAKAAPVARAPVSKPARRAVTAPASVSVAPAPTPSANEYGPIRRSETLWSIAERVRPGKDISVEQVMIALLRANPHAFDGNNINRLKAGVTLAVPSRDDVLSMSAREARAESSRQYQDWKSGSAESVAESTPSQPESDVQAATDAPADSSVVAESESRLQLTAPEADAVSGAALPGDPVAGDAESGGAAQQLALAAEEVAAGRAQSRELQSQVGELEEQITTMKRLLELKDDELARLQQNLSTEELSTAGQDEALDTAAAEEIVATIDEADSASAEEVVTEAATDESALESLADQPAGLVNRLMENPLLAGLGVLVAMLLGGFVWASTRSRAGGDILDDDLTMERQLAAATAHADDAPTQAVEINEPEPVAEDRFAPPADDEADSDPVTEADVYLAYGRIQQAEDVLLAALQTRPENVEARIKLLEVYHSGGNTVAFDQAAEAFHEMFGEDNDNWQKIAGMGMALSPHNTLYGGGGSVPDDGADFDMDLSGLEDVTPQSGAGAPAETESNTIEFTVDTIGDDDEDIGEGLLDSADEMTTKLDLARAYIDMDDKDSARSILGEVIEEGNAEQKEEAESIISNLA